jgi:hypothetical protein
VKREQADDRGTPSGVGGGLDEFKGPAFAGGEAQRLRDSHSWWIRLLGRAHLCSTHPISTTHRFQSTDRCMSRRHSFLFWTDRLVLPSGQHICAFVPTGVITESHLILSLAEQLRFPSYFGENWNALEECLRDLSWLEERIVIVVHNDVPDIPDHSLRVYIDILDNCVKDWGIDESHQLMVFFPFFSKNAVEDALK